MALKQAMTTFAKIRLIILRGTNKLKLKPKPKTSEGMNVFSRLARASVRKLGTSFLPRDELRF